MKRCYNKLNIVSFFAILFFSYSLALAQGTMTGKITDSRGEAIIGANVFISGTNIGAAADFDGNYTIKNVPAGSYTLIISAVGYKTEEFSITSSRAQFYIRRISPSTTPAI